jgi:hypothetical protein
MQQNLINKIFFDSDFVKIYKQAENINTQYLEQSNITSFREFCVISILQSLWIEFVDNLISHETIAKNYGINRHKFLLFLKIGRGINHMKLGNF